MTPEQAGNFATNWRVVDQYNSPTGLSATVFEEIGSGKRYLAVRGTEPSDLNDVITDVIDIGVLGTSDNQAQYAALSAKVQEWLDTGVLQSGFTVAGHSLGGFLATNLALEYSADVAHTYIYNAPGVTGVGDNVYEAIANALSPGNPITIPPVLSISNIVAMGDVVSEVGLPIAPPIELIVEPQSAFGAHSISATTDALAIYNLFAKIDPDVNVDSVSNILLSLSNESSETLESALSALGAIFGKNFPATETSREDYYANLYDLESAIGGQPAGLTIDVFGITDANDGTFVPLAPYDIETRARTDIAYRCALVEGNPFAVLGADYSAFNQNGEMDIHDPATGQGQLTNMYLADRSEMLTHLIYANVNDTTDSDSDIHFVDLAKDISLNEPLLMAPSKKIAFGSANGDVLQGTVPFLGSDTVIDRLYGMGGK